MLLHVTRQLPHTLGGDLPREVSLQTGPLFHIGGVQALVRQLLVGGTMVFPTGRFDPAEVLDLIESEGVHRWGGVPTMVNRVLSEPSIGRRDLTTVRSISLGGSPVPPELVTRIKTRFPNVERGVSQVYGLSEGGGTLTAASGRDLVERPGTAGRPLPLVELRIERPDEKGTGEVVARTPTQMLGYWGQASDDAIDAERLGPHGRSGPRRRRRLPLHHRPDEGPHHPGRGEHRRPPRGERAAAVTPRSATSPSAVAPTPTSARSWPPPWCSTRPAP